MGNRGNFWWEKGSVRITEGYANIWAYDTLEIDQIPEIVEKYAKTAGNATHLPCMQFGIGGQDHRKPIFKVAGQEIEKDLLKKFIEEFHKWDMKVIVYFNGHAFVPTFYEDHPDWVQSYEGGKPAIDIYDTGSSACPNSEGFRKWQAGIIKDLCKYEIDGIFLDGDVFFEKTCYCDTCKAKFKEKYGFEMPLKRERTHPKWRFLRQFQIDCLTEYVGCLYKALKEERPHSLLYCNAGLRTANWTTGRQNRRLMEVQDILFSEGGFLYNNISSYPVWLTECENKLCVSQSGGKPVVSGGCAGHKPWNFYSLPPKEVKLMVCSAIASGTQHWMAIVWSGNQPGDVRNDESEVAETLHEINTFIKNNENVLYPASSMAKAAIVWSNVNADFYQGGGVKKTDFTKSIQGVEVGDLHMEFEGLYDAFFRNHIPLDVLDEVSLTNGSLDRYDLVILPNIACMSDRELNAVRTYVKNGGCIVSTFETSAYNEFGEARDDFGLGDVFGVQSGEEVFGPSLWNYVLSREEGKAHVGCLSRFAYIPSPKYGIATVKGEATEAMTFSKLMAGSYDDLPRLGENGFLYVNQYGKGKSFYFAGTVGQLATEWRFPEYLDIVRDIAAANSRSPVTVSGAPETVSVNVFKNPETGNLLIYLVNYTGSMSRPTRNVCRISNVKLQLDPAISMKEVRSLYSRNNLRIENLESGCELTVCSLDEFEAIEVVPGCPG